MIAVANIQFMLCTYCVYLRSVCNFEVLAFQRLYYINTKQASAALYDKNTMENHY